MNRNFKRSAVVGGTVAAVFGVGVGLAAWTNYGEGSGAVTAGQATALTVNVTGVTGLYPTKSVTVPFTVRNPNPYDVKLTKATLVDVTVTSSPGACAASVVTGTDVTSFTPTDVVAAGQTSGSYSFPVTMSNTAADGCQNAVFSVKLGVTGLSN